MSPDTPSTSADRFGVFVTTAQRWATSCCEEDKAGMTGPDQPADVYAGPYRRSSAERAAGGPADAVSDRMTGCRSHASGSVGRMVYRSVGLIVPGALCSLSWGGCISAEPAVGDAAQDRDGRGQGPALVVGERFDVG